jgi:hypothetical protein
MILQKVSDPLLVRSRDIESTTIFAEKPTPRCLIHTRGGIQVPDRAYQYQV